MSTIVNLIPNKIREISPEKFLKLDQHEKQNIESCRFVPPTIGDSGFGKFIVTVKIPTYAVDHANR